MTIPASTPTGFQPSDAERVQNQADLNAVLALLSGQPSGAGTATQVLHGGAAGFATIVNADITSVDAGKITTGTLPIARGGTNGTAAAVNGAVVYSTASAYAMTAAGTSGQLLQSAGAASPVWAGETTWTAPTLGNNWSNFGSGNSTAGYLKDASGFVHVRGSLTNSAGVNTVAFTLPSGYRPALNQNFCTRSFTSGAVEKSNPIISIDSSGNVTVGANNTGDKNFFSIDNICFDTR